jgi:chondroitin 4-sulfotransferase 11
MPIIHDKKAIFIHIPKTGGKSLTEILFPNGRPPNRLKYLEGPLVIPKYGQRHLSHLPYVIVKELIGIDAWDSYWKFAFVRNPWDRTVSNYFYLQQKFPKHEHPMLKFTHTSTFPEFIKALEKTLFIRDQFAQWGKDHFIPQYEYIWDGTNLVVDFCGRFENFNTDVDIILSKLKIKAEIPFKNSSKHLPFQEYYTPELINTVGELYQKDVDLFGYEF